MDIIALSLGLVARSMSRPRHTWTQADEALLNAVTNALGGEFKREPDLVDQAKGVA